MKFKKKMLIFVPWALCNPAGAENFEMGFKFLKNLIITLSSLDSYVHQSHF